jgi:flagellar FliL protein
MAKKEKPEGDARTDQKAGRSKKPLLILVALLALCLAAAVVWYLGHGGHSQNARAEQSKTNDEQKPAALQPKFAALEQFTVNLQREQNEQLLQTTISLKYFDPALEERIKANMPAIRNAVLLLLSGKHASELMTVDGKKQLAGEIRNGINAVLGIRSTASGAMAEVAPAAASGVAQAAPVAPGGTDEAQDAGEAPQGIAEVLYSNFIIQ